MQALAGGACVFRSFGETARTTNGFQTQTQPPVDGPPLSGRELLGLTAASPDGLPVAPIVSTGGWIGFPAVSASITPGPSLQSPDLVDLLLLDEPTNNLDAAGCDHLVGGIAAAGGSRVWRRAGESRCGNSLPAVCHHHAPGRGAAMMTFLYFSGPRLAPGHGRECPAMSEFLSGLFAIP